MYKQLNFVIDWKRQGFSNIENQIPSLNYTELLTKDETVKTTQNFRNMTIWRLIFGFCIKLSILMIHKMIKHRQKPMLAYKEPWMQENGLNKFLTIFSLIICMSQLCKNHSIQKKCLYLCLMKSNSAIKFFPNLTNLYI